MLSLLSGIWDFITSIFSFVADFIASIVRLFSLLTNSLGYLSGALFTVPGELLAFGVGFIMIMVLNRLTGGNNSASGG